MQFCISIVKLLMPSDQRQLYPKLKCSNSDYLVPLENYKYTDIFVFNLSVLGTVVARI